jgi:hypothetical protein
MAEQRGQQVPESYFRHILWRPVPTICFSHVTLASLFGCDP